MTPSDTTIAYKVQIFLKVQVHQNCYVIVTGLLFTIGTLAQVGAYPIKLENTSRRSLDVLHLGHLLRRPARASNTSWKPNRIRLRVRFGVQEQSALKQASRSHTGSDLGALYMVGKIIPRRFQWHWYQAQINPESTGIVKTR